MKRKLGQTQIIPNGRDEFLKQCDTEAFLKFNSCFSTEFAREKIKYVSEKLL